MTKLKEKSKGIFDRIRKVKHIHWIIAGVAIAIMLTIYFSSFFSSRSSAGASDNNNQQNVSTAAGDYLRQKEERLAFILSQIDGVGRTEVFISWESGIESVIAFITNETSGGSSSAPAIITGPGGSRPIVLHEILPRATGVIVVAQGAGEMRVRLSIINAVTATLDVSADRISVFAMRQ